MNDKLHPALAEHRLEMENEKLRGLLREIRDVYNTHRNEVGDYWAQRIDAALSQQAEPECSRCNDVGIVGNSMVCPECADTWRQALLPGARRLQVADGQRRFVHPREQQAMNKPTGKLAFAYQTIANMEAKIDTLRAELDSIKAQRGEPVVYAVHAKGMTVDADCPLVPASMADDYVPGCATPLYTAPPATDALVEFVTDCAGTAGCMVNGNRLSARASELLATYRASQRKEG